MCMWAGPSRINIFQIKHESSSFTSSHHSQQRIARMLCPTSVSALCPPSQERRRPGRIRAMRFLLVPPLILHLSVSATSPQKGSSTLCRAAHWGDHLQLLIPQSVESCTVIQPRLEVRLLDGSPSDGRLEVRSGTYGFALNRQGGQKKKQQQQQNQRHDLVEFQLVRDSKMCVSQWENVKLETWN